MKCVHLAKIAAMAMYVHRRASVLSRCRGDVNSGGAALIRWSDEEIWYADSDCMIPKQFHRIYAIWEFGSVNYA